MNSPSEISLRPYQAECVRTIEAQKPGSYLIQMATGLGKTVTFASIPRHGRMLILSHREELVEQPRKYFTCSYGIERAGQHSNGEEVVSASVQSMVRRLKRYSPTDFDTIIWDECHHCAAKSYRKIFDYFKPRLNLGFTATPNRSDDVRLDDVFSDIIFQRDLRWGIANGYLSDIYCLRVTLGYDLSRVRMRGGDYAPGELDKAMDGTADGIAQAYREHANGATLIFAVSVRHAGEIAARIPGAVVVTGETKDRAEIIERFTAGEIPCIVNCMVFTEGTDIPRVETVIIARPTKSDSLYAQMVGRGLRLYPGKDKLTLIDCVDVSGTASLCTAPSLLGIDMEDVPGSKRDEVQGMLFDLPERAIMATDCPESWIRNVTIVDLWAKSNHYDTHSVNFFKMPDGRMVVSLLGGEKLTIPAPDMLGFVTCKDGSKIDMQDAIDRVTRLLQTRYKDQEYLWNRKVVEKWGGAPATEKQLEIIRKRCPGFDVGSLSKGQASQILNRLFSGRGSNK